MLQHFHVYSSGDYSTLPEVQRRFMDDTIALIQKSEENYIMRSLMISTAHTISFG